ncbi:MAG: hypothetical protein IJY12_05330 [Clostridia bacterium]|nr:hypothetical protein [Clostridia bacterium]
MQEDSKNNVPELPEEESNAAKLLRLRGGTEDKIHDEKEIIQEYDRVKNFWYHNKWIVIFAVIFLVGGIVLGSQMIGRTDPDASIMFVGPYAVGATATSEDIEETFTLITEDYNGDGEVAFRFASLLCYNDAQLEAIRTEEDEEGNTMDALTYSRLLQTNTEEKEGFYKIIFLDEFVIWLLDPAFYEEVKKADGFVPLSDIFDYEVEAAIDDTGIRFMETEFAQYYSCFAEMPEDTVLCLRRLSTAAGKGGKAKHENNTEFFRAIVEFKAE